MNVKWNRECEEEKMVKWRKTESVKLVEKLEGRGKPGCGMVQVNGH